MPSRRSRHLSARWRFQLLVKVNINGIQGTLVPRVMPNNLANLSLSKIPKAWPIPMGPFFIVNKPSAKIRTSICRRHRWWWCEGRSGHADETWIRRGSVTKTVNLKAVMPPVDEAIQRLDREIASARQQRSKFFKIIHGYGSSGEGGDIRIAVQKRLVEMIGRGEVRACIF